MVKLKFIVRSSVLVLRVSEGKQRFYKSVKHLLIDNPDVEKYWLDGKERFSRSAPSFVENNYALEEFKLKYSQLSVEHPEFTARQVASAFSADYKSAKVDVAEKLVELDSAATFVEPYIQTIANVERAKQGCNFEVYAKLLNKCRKLIPKFELLRFSDIDFNKCVYIASIFGQHTGYLGTTKAFRAVLGRAPKDDTIDFKLSRIGDFEFHKYNPAKHDMLIRQPDVLSPAEIKKFLNLDTFNVTPTYSDRETVELYYDFCVFMFHSFFAPCDVIKLKYKHITKNNTILARRKKTHKGGRYPLLQRWGL